MKHREVYPRCEEEISRCDVAFAMMSQNLSTSIEKCKGYSMSKRISKCKRRGSKCEPTRFSNT